MIGDSWFTRGAAKIKDLGQGGRTIEQHGIGSITTTSMNEIIKLFGDNIIWMTADGSGGTITDKLDINAIGAFFKTKTISFFSMRYGEKKHTANLTQEWIKKITKAQEKYGISDASVHRLIVRIEDSELGDLVAEFKAEKCESKELCEKWKSYTINQRNMEDQRFQYRMLNMKKLQTRKVFRAKTKECLCEWDNAYLDSPAIYPQTLKRNGHFGFYGIVKYFKKDEKDIWALDRVET